MSTENANALRLERINKKGWEVAQRLAAVKASQNLELADIKGLTMDDLDEPPAVRLRRYLDQINAARARLSTEAYGLCMKCGVRLADAQLDEMPWVELCAPCDAAS